MEMSESTQAHARGTGSRSLRSWWGDRGVKAKVLAAVAVAALVAGLVGVLGLAALSRSAASNQSMYEVNVHSLNASADMRFALSDLRIAARSAALAATPEKTQEYLDSIPEITERFHVAIEGYLANDVADEQQRLVDEAAKA